MCEGVSLAALARRHGTPLYVYSAGAIRGAIREIREAFAEFDPLVCYAMKANGTLGILKLAASEGCSVEVVSGGELYRARAAGLDPRRMVFSGVGKTDGEIESALRARILMFNVESVPELRAIARVASRLRTQAPVELRINPHVDAHTHRYITTGTHENKFGIDWTRAEAAFAEASRLRGINLIGIHSHIGSQITDPKPFAAAAARIDGLLDRLDRRGIRLTYRNIGGGLGISYRPGQRRLNVAAVARLLAPSLRRRPMRIILEPGRFLVGEAGAILTRVVYVKRGIRKSFVIVDAAMNDLIRPALYEAHHEILAVRPRPGRLTADVVGPICESGDFLGVDRNLPAQAAGDLLAILGAGAYGNVMSSNYNARPRAAEVLVEGRAARVIRRRETLADLVRGESV